MNLLTNQFNFTNNEYNKFTYTEIMNMDYWKFEEFITMLNDSNTERAKQEKKASEEQSKQQQSSMPSMKIPKMNIPKLR